MPRHGVDAAAERDRHATRVDVEALLPVDPAQHRVVLLLEAGPADDLARRQVRPALHVVRRGHPGEAEHRAEQRSRRVGPTRIRDDEHSGDPGRADGVADAARHLCDGQRQRRACRRPDLRAQILAGSPDQVREPVDVDRSGAQQRRHHEHLVQARADVHGVHRERRVVPISDRPARCGQREAPRHLLLPGQEERLTLRGLQPPSVEPEGHQQRRQPECGQPDQPRPRVAPARQGPQPPPGAVAADGQDDPDRGQVYDERRSPVAEQRERDARQRKEPEVAARRHDGLDTQEDRQPAADECAERGAGRPAGQCQPPDEDDRGEDGARPGDQSPLADQARQRQVGLSLGQVLGAKEPQRVVGPAEQRPRADRDLGLAHGPAGAGRGLVRTDQEAAEPLDLVRPQQPDDERRRDGRRRRPAAAGTGRGCAR